MMWTARWSSVGEPATPDGGGGDGHGKGGKNAQEQHRGKGPQELYTSGCPSCGGPHNLHGCEYTWGPTVARVWRSLGKPSANDGKNRSGNKGNGNKGNGNGNGNRGGNGDGGRGGGRGNGNKGGRGYPPVETQEEPEAAAEQPRRRTGRRQGR